MYTYTAVGGLGRRDDFVLYRVMAPGPPLVGHENSTLTAHAHISRLRAWCALNIGKYFEDRSIDAGTVSSAWYDGENRAIDHLEDRETGSNTVGRWNEGRTVRDTSKLLERMRALRRVH